MNRNESCILSCFNASHSNSYLTTRVLTFRVGMSCGGCKNAVTNIMNKVPGVTKVCASVQVHSVVIVCVLQFEVDVEKKSLVVHGTAAKETISSALSKWAAAGKKEVTFLSETTA